MSARHILVVDDEVGIRELLRDILEDEGYHVRLAENAAEARKTRQQMRPDLVLLDIWMPDCDGISLLKEWSSQGLLTMPVVMMSGHATVDTAVEATRIGAIDFLEKPIALQKLLKTVSNALSQADKIPRQTLNFIHLGRSPAIAELRQRIEHASHNNNPLLLLGNIGSGAELCARALHKVDTPWLSLDQTEKLSEAPLDLLEELRGGVLFIDEIANLDRIEQKGLWMLLNKAEKYSVRVICSTSRNLPQLIPHERFDENLLSFLTPLSIKIPTLEEHREDIPDLATALLSHAIESGNLSYHELDTAALNTLRNAAWPGGLNQLENTIKELATTSTSETISSEDVERILRKFDHLTSNIEATLPISLDQPLRDARDEFERLYFKHHIAKCGGNMSKVAEAVGLERTHLYRKLKQLDISK